MTPATGLFVALIGLVIAALGGIPLWFIGERDPGSDDSMLEIIVLNLTGVLGLTVLVMGLTIAAITAMLRKHRLPL